jgi:hypothetical protein
VSREGTIFDPTGPSFLFPDPFDVLADTRMGQEQVSRVVFPAQQLLVGNQVVNTQMALLAEPEALVAHLVQGEPAAKPFLTMAMSRNQVVKGQQPIRPFAQFARSVHSILIYTERGSPGALLRAGSAK